MFAPGAENYAQMGAIDAIWPEPSAALLEAALAELLRFDAAAHEDRRRELGQSRGGRLLAAPTVAAIHAFE